LKCRRKKFGQFSKIIELLPKKLSLSSQTYGLGIRDPRSGIRKKPIPDPGVKKAPDPGSGSATLEEFCLKNIFVSIISARSALNTFARKGKDTDPGPHL
jgi:hypothetical protein